MYKTLPLQFASWRSTVRCGLAILCLGGVLQYFIAIALALLVQTHSSKTVGDWSLVHPDGTSAYIVFLYQGLGWQALECSSDPDDLVGSGAIEHTLGQWGVTPVIWNVHGVVESLRESRPSDVFPSWSYASRLSGIGSAPCYEQESVDPFVYEIGFGWPRISASYVVSKPDYSSPEHEVQGGLQIRGLPGIERGLDRYLPLHISWTGAAFNTMCIAGSMCAVWFGSLIVVVAVRRRLRRCINCGYSQIGLLGTRCPECGRPILRAKGSRRDW